LDAGLQEALEKETIVHTHDELLSDAQAAAVENNMRRAVVELAIAVETAAKQSFFAKSTPAGIAFSFIEGRASIRVLDLIDGVAKEAFGESFKKAHGDHYRNIDYLFRCRNKAVHRGEIVFRDDKEKLVTLNSTLLQEWWLSVDALIHWLKKHSTNL
jgi:hypothetical protein